MKGRRVTELDKAIGQKLEAARRGRGLSQSDVARALGLTFQQIQKYESGTNRIAVSTLLRLCAALDFEVTAFLPEIEAAGDVHPDPLSALGATVEGRRLAKVCAELDSQGRKSVLSVAEAIAGAKAVRTAAAEHLGAVA